MPVDTRRSHFRLSGRKAQGSINGLDANLYWPGSGEVPAVELVLRRLLPLAHEGLARWGMDQALAGRLLGIIEQRCINGQNGAAWQAATVAAISEGGADRAEALRQMTQRYIEHMHTNEPVHTWPSGA